MAKYHIKPESGEPGNCDAKPGNCPYGSDAEHYTSKVAARAAYEKQQTDKLVFEKVAHDVKLYGEDSSVFRSWSKISQDYKLVKDGKRFVLANGGGKGTVLTEWHGPAVLKSAKEMTGFGEEKTDLTKVTTKDFNFGQATRNDFTGPFAVDFLEKTGVLGTLGRISAQTPNESERFIKTNDDGSLRIDPELLVKGHPQFSRSETVMAKLAGSLMGAKAELNLDTDLAYLDMTNRRRVLDMLADSMEIRVAAIPF